LESGSGLVSVGPALTIAGSCLPVLGYLIANRQRQVSRIELAETLWADRDGENAVRANSLKTNGETDAAGPDANNAA
jgi:hypothetical protein